ncbi:universal stress protein [Streptomyces sp. NPDC014894]|uniref:universal stress protein n=1 Tax=Streptomyces sp. NPDC014894 TaxID=3364931 RepID=UPI00370061E5
MTVIAWIVEGTWAACVDAVRAHAPRDDDVLLLHVTGPEAADAARGAYAGLLGRSRPDRDPAVPLESLAASAAERLLAGAAARLDRPAILLDRTGRPEREVVSAAEGAALLVLARDGDRTRPGPHSLGPATRFVVDHAPCPVLLVWPGPAPDPAAAPPPPA